VTHVCQYMKASDLYPAQYILDKGGHLALIGPPAYKVHSSLLGFSL
jgi:hypothetical protein